MRAPEVLYTQKALDRIAGMKYHVLRRTEPIVSPDEQPEEIFGGALQRDGAYNVCPIQSGGSAEECPSRNRLRMSLKN